MQIAVKQPVAFLARLLDMFLDAVRGNAEQLQDVRYQHQAAFQRLGNDPRRACRLKRFPVVIIRRADQNGQVGAQQPDFLEDALGILVVVEGDDEQPGVHQPGLAQQRPLARIAEQHGLASRQGFADA